MDGYLVRGLPGRHQIATAVIDGKTAGHGLGREVGEGGQAAILLSYAKQGQQAAGPLAAVEKTAIRRDMQIRPPALSLISLGQHIQALLLPDLAICVTPIAVDGAIELVKAVDVAIDGMQRQVSWPGPFGGMQVPQGVGQQLTISTEDKAADGIFGETGDQGLLFSSFVRQQGNRVSRHQWGQLLMRRLHNAAGIDGGDGDVVEGIRGGKQEAPAGIDSGMGGAARQRGRALFCEFAICVDPVAYHRKIGAHGSMEPFSVRADHQGLYLTRSAYHLQELHLPRVGQGKHMDLLAAGAGDINDLLHCASHSWLWATAGQSYPHPPGSCLIFCSGRAQGVAMTAKPVGLASGELEIKRPRDGAFGVLYLMYQPGCGPGRAGGWGASDSTFCSSPFMFLM